MLLTLLLDPGQRSCKENCKESTRRQRSWEEKLLELLGRHLQDQEESQEAILEYLLEVSVMNLTGAQGRMKEVSVYLVLEMETLLVSLLEVDQPETRPQLASP